MKRRWKALLVLALCLTGCTTTESQKTMEQKVDAVVKQIKTLDFDFTPTIDEQVIHDGDGVVITALSLEYRNNNAYLNLKIQNTSDKPLSISSCTLGYNCNSISGYMIDEGYIHEDLPIGESVETDMRFNTDELLMHGITQIANIDVGFTISDEDYNSVYTKPARVNTSCTSQYDYQIDTYQQTIESNPVLERLNIQLESFEKCELYNAGGLKVVSKAIAKTSGGKKVLLLEVENTTDDLLYFRMENIRLNDVVAYEGNWNTGSVNGKTRRVMYLSIDAMADKLETEMPVNEITEIKSSVYVIDQNRNNRNSLMDMIIQIK